MILWIEIWESRPKKAGTFGNLPNRFRKIPKILGIWESQIIRKIMVFSLNFENIVILSDVISMLIKPFEDKPYMYIISLITL